MNVAAFLRIVVITLLGLCTGSVVAALAVGFVELIAWLNDVLLISPRSRMLAGNGIWLTVMTIAVPTAGGLVAGLLCLLIPERRPHGPPEAIRAAQSLDGAMPVRGGVVTAVAACVALGSGASVGQYGPLAHIGATVGSWFGRLFGTSQYLGTVGIGCGAAAAIATAFNAPIAGLVFAHEVILRHYSLRAFAPITVAATLGYVVANLVFERPPLFRIDTVQTASSYEFIIFMAIGMVGAVLALILMKGVLICTKISGSCRLAGPLKTALAGMAVGIVALQIPEVLGIGKEVLRFAIIDKAFASSELALILAAKLVLTALCLGMGIAGGIFSPSLLIGILFGALVGSGAELLLGDGRSPIAVYAICGMVAVTSPVIGAPLTTILIVFELTRNYDLATAAMVSVAFANLVGYRIFGRSLFDVQLRTRGFDLSMGRDKVIVEMHTVSELVSQDMTAISDTSSIARVRDALMASGRTVAYIRKEDGQYLGSVTLNQLNALDRIPLDRIRSDRIPEDRVPEDKIPKDRSLSDIVQTDTLRLDPADTLWEAMQKMEDFVGESIPVIEEGRLCGVVFEASIVKAYLRVLKQIRVEENAA